MRLALGAKKFLEFRPCGADTLVVSTNHRTGGTMIPFTKDELSDMVWLATGKTPSHVRTQAMLVVGEFADGSTSVHHIDHLVVKSAMSQRWPVRSYMDAEERLS